MFDVQTFLDDYRIDWTERDAGRGGWTNVNCCFCVEGDDKQKLGIHPDGYCNCWRCGKHSLEDFAKRMFRVEFKQARAILAPYERLGMLRMSKAQVYAATVEPPGGELRRIHRDYLWDRDFDPDWAVEEYAVTGTGSKERWKDIWFADRLILPIRDRTRRVISFQGRDVSGESEIRYKGCPVDLSVKHYKQTFYGLEHARPDLIVVVEGIFDQWRLGRGSVASFGTSLTEHQVTLLAEWPAVIFAFDSEAQAQERARMYAARVAAFGREVDIVDLELEDGDDMADLTDREASDIRRALGLA